MPQADPSDVPATKGTFFVPNRLDLEALQLLEKEFGQEQRIVWLVDSDSMPTGDIHHYLQEQKALGLVHSPLTGRIKDLQKEILGCLHRGHHLVFIPPAQKEHVRQAHCLTQAQIKLIHDLQLPITPLYIDEEKMKGEPYCQVLTELAATPALPALLHSAWLEGSAQELSRHLDEHPQNLALMLISALRDSRHACIISGVDQSVLSFAQVLHKSIRLAQHLRKTHSMSERLGILLPPGHNAICANIACLLAGIVPVNIDESLHSDCGQALIQSEGICRFITDKRTSLKLQESHQLSPRDFILLDSIFKNFGKMRTKKLIDQLAPPEFLLQWLIKPIQRSLDDEALLLFSKGQEDGIPKATSISHRNLLAQLTQLQQLLPIAQLNTTLSSLPYHTGVGLYFGLLFPILSGQNIITYPIEDKIEQLARLMSDYKVEYTFTKPKLLYKLIENDVPQSALQSLQFFISSGSLLSKKMRESIESRWGIPLINAYTLTELGSLASIERLGTRPHQENDKSSLHTMCSAGQPLLGTAVRIGNPASQDIVIPHGELGGLWMKGPAIAAPPNTWVSTGDIARIDKQGRIYIEGRRTRFSRIENQLISHQAVEQVLYRYFKLPLDQGHLLAVIGLQLHQQERLVLLSTVHKSFEPNDQVTMRYGIGNMKYPFTWCPSKVILLPRIPLLANGQLDYKTCCSIAYQALGVPEPTQAPHL